MTRNWRVGYAIAALVVAYCVHWLDVSLASKIAPMIASTFGKPLEAMALVFSGSRLGLAIGAILGGLAGDRWGRKWVLCTCLGLAALVSLVTPLISNFTLFALLRAASGVLLGGAAPCALSLVASIAPERWRSMSITATLAGASMGSSLGSLLVYSMTGPTDWRMGFWICGIALIATLALSCWWVTDTHESSVARTSASSLKLSGPMRTTTLLLGTGFLLSMGLNALLASWLPSFFHVSSGVPVQEFAGIAMFTTPAAVAGMLMVGWFVPHTSWQLLLLACFGSHAVALALLGMFSFASSGFITALAIASCAQAACQGLLTLAVVSRYPVASRATALGCAAAAGRVGSIFSPAIGALALQFPIKSMFLLFATIPLLVGMLLWVVKHDHPDTGRL